MDKKAELKRMRRKGAMMDKKAELKRMWRLGVSLREIASALGISRSSAQRYASKLKTWATSKFDQARPHDGRNAR